MPWCWRGARASGQSGQSQQAARDSDHGPGDQAEVPAKTARPFADRGYDATTIADIAAAAEVAPRTVAMYFPSKQDIAMARFSQSVEELTGLLHDRSRGESEELGQAILASVGPAPSP